MNALGIDRLKLAEIFPGVDIRKVDMTAYNRSVDAHEGRHPGKYRQLHFYRLIPDEDDNPQDQDLNMHLCAHLYASDRNSLEMVPRTLGRESKHTSMASVSHTVIFHGQAQDSNMLDENGQPKWFVQEAWASRSGEGRACHESRLWDWQEGTVVGTTVQDGMMRVVTDTLQAKKIEKSRI